MAVALIALLVCKLAPGQDLFVVVVMILLLLFSGCVAVQTCSAEVDVVKMADMLGAKRQLCAQIH
jgi:hypothetical protein